MSDFNMDVHCNRMVIELYVMEIWSEIIIVNSNYAFHFRPNCTSLNSVTIMKNDTLIIMLVFKSKHQFTVNHSKFCVAFFSINFYIKNYCIFII